MKILAHRGVRTEYPENTMAAFRVAAEQNYDGIAIETGYTKDGVCVVFSDETLNRTCRTQNGEVLPDTIRLDQVTWEELQQYDIGYHKSYKFKGWTVPSLEEVCQFAKEHQLLLKIEKVDGRIEQIVRKSGVSLIDETVEVQITDGRMKPLLVPLRIYDMHNHTHFSHDASRDATAGRLCDEAVKRGLLGVAITNHCDINENSGDECIQAILDSLKEAEMAAQTHQGLKILYGIEIGGVFWNQEVAEKAIKAYDYDVVLGSIHSIRTPLAKKYKNFSEYPEDALQEYYDTYLDDVYRLVSGWDMDVLTHITYPQRYIIGQFGRQLDTERFYPKMDRIFRKMIERGIALELNTSCVNAPYGLVMPYKEIVERYLNLGGRLLTLGSDSHWAEHCGAGFTVAAQMLRKLGVKELYYFEKRVPIAYRPEILQ